MQPLTDDARRVITADQVTIGYGCELVRPDLSVVEDISDDVLSVKVSRKLNANIHGTVEVTLSRELTWGRDRIRPYITVASGSRSVRFPMGVYMLQTPDRVLDSDPPQFVATGMDVLWYMSRLIGDSYAAAQGVGVLDEVRQVVADSGVGAPVILSSDSDDAVLDKARGWPLLTPPDDGATEGEDDDPSQSPSWLRVCNDLLGSIGYRGMWADWNGALRSGLYRNPKTQPAEWAFTPDDPKLSIVKPGRKITLDVWGQPNRWIFYRNGIQGQPVAGQSLYVVDNLDDGPSSQLSIGLVPADPVGLDAASYDALVAAADRKLAAMTAPAALIDATVQPYLGLWHADIATWVTDGIVQKAQCVSWTCDLASGEVQSSWQVVG